MKTNKREIILEAASKIFSEKGYHMTTVEEIAKEAEVGKGTIYQYFSSKAEIFHQMRCWHLERYVQQLNELLDSDDTFRNNLERIIDHHIENVSYMIRFIDKAAQEIVDEMGDEPHRGDTFDLLKNIEAKIIRLLNISIERGEIRPINVHIAVHLLEGILMGVVKAMMSDINDDNKTEIKNELIDLLLNGIGA